MYVIDSKTPAKDLQLVSITIRILERPNEANLTRLYLDQRQNYAERVLPNITNEVIKNVVARYNPDQLITQRERVSNEIKHGLITKAIEYNVVIDDVAIIHIDFSKEYRNAIESKQVSQQMAERYKLIFLFYLFLNKFFGKKNFKNFFIEKIIRLGILRIFSMKKFFKFFLPKNLLFNYCFICCTCFI